MVLLEAEVPLHAAVAFKHVSDGPAVHASTQKMFHDSLLDCILTSEGTSKPQAQALLDQLTKLAAGAQKVLAAADAMT